MERIICLAVGDAFGLFQTGYWDSRMHDVDIRSKGSGNSGTTNVLRVMGVKAGILVFLGDFFKTVIPCVIVRIIWKDEPGLQHLLVLYTALGVILGHNFPFYMGFKGGKGIAATAGLLAAMDLRVAVVCLLAFVLIVAVTRYVSLGSLVVVTIFLAGMIWFSYRGEYGLTPGSRLEFCAVSAVVTGMAFWRHRSNIGRLLHGTENKLGSKK